MIFVTRFVVLVNQYCREGLSFGGLELGQEVDRVVFFTGFKPTWAKLVQKKPTIAWVLAKKSSPCNGTDKLLLCQVFLPFL